MFLGLAIYVCGGKYLPREETKEKANDRVATENPPASQMKLWLLLLGVGVAATIFRGAYEQIGNTIPLWTDIAVDRSLGRFVIPMTWFQALNPLLVIAMTPPLLLYWKRRAENGRDTPPARRMAIGAFIVAAAYLLLASISTVAGTNRAGWLWLVLFFLIFTVGELHILPTGLGLFARLAPPRLGATTVASWFLAIFTGSMLAGLVGTMWSWTSHGIFFVVLAGFAILAAALLLVLNRPIQALAK